MNPIAWACLAAPGLFLVGAGIVSGLRRAIDWMDGRAYQPPAPIRTVDIAPLPVVDHRVPAVAGEVVPATEGPQPAADVEAFRPDAAALRILLGLIAEAAAREAAVQRALYRAPAPIWCQLTAEWELVKAGAPA